MYDIIIVGAGIIGSLIAKDLSKYNIKVLLLEKNNDVGNETTSANSAIVHSGHDPLDNTLKAKFNVLGNRMYKTLCTQLDCKYQEIGAYVVCNNEDELTNLDNLYLRAKSRNIPVSYIDKEELIIIEPNLSENIIKAISLPTTGIVCPFEISISAVELAMDNNVELRLNTKVINIIKKDDFIIETNNGVFSSKIIINCAGVYADEIYRLVNPSTDLKIEAYKGEYYVLDHLNKPLVNKIVYPLPTKLGKGVLIVPTVHNNTLLGPNRVKATKDDIKTTSESLSYLQSQLNNSVKHIPFHKVIRTFSGLRATCNRHDFVIEESQKIKNFINVLGIESPGVASAPAISDYVVETLIKNIIPLRLKEEYKSSIRKKIRLKELNEKDINNLISKDVRYSKIICRCEQISECEIIDCIHRNNGATTVKGVKKRCRPGMGRCQGGFCQPLIVDILAKELKKDKTDILYNELHSEILIDNKKGAI